MSFFLNESTTVNTIYKCHNVSVHHWIFHVLYFQNYQCLKINFLVCQSMPLPLPIYSLFFFFTSSKTISRMNIYSNECKGIGWNRERPSWQNYQEINFFLKLWPCSWLNQAKSNKKIINNYFCVWTCLNSHGKLLFIFKFEQVVMKGNSDH